MSALSVSNQHATFSPLPLPKSVIVARYKHLRSVRINLNSTLTSLLSAESLHEGGRRLRMLRGKTFFFNDPDESNVLADYCLYDIRKNGVNVIDQYLANSPPDDGTDEMTILRSMQHAIYSCFEIESAESGLGIFVLDLFSKERHLIVDIGLGSTGVPGMIFASRILPFDGFSMTGGAAILIGIPPQDNREMVVGVMEQLLESRPKGDSAELIETCLKLSRSPEDRLEQNHGQLSESDEIGMPVRSEKRIGRNDKCSCGSGKKFKHCCLRRD